MALPTIQVIFTLFVAHVVILVILLFCWLFIRHAQKKHVENMALNRVRNMPKAEHPDLKQKILEQPREPTIVLPSRLNSVKKTTTKNTTKSYEKEWAQVEEELKVLRGSFAPNFKNKSPTLNEGSKQEKISSEQSQLAQVVESVKTQNQDEFEKHFSWVQNAIVRKGYRDPGLRSYESQLDSIDETLATLNAVEGQVQESSSNADKIKPQGPSHKQSHQDWRASVAADFENLYRMTVKSAKKHSLFRKKTDEPFVAMHKADVEKEAIKLVQKIAKRIEGDHPIPAPELDWIEASLQDVHSEIWKKKEN